MRAARARVPPPVRNSAGQAERSRARRDRSVIERAPRPMAMVPDWTSSVMPYCSSIFSMASSLSAPPVASIVTASGETSTVLARNSWTISTIWERVSLSARTFTRTSSRWIAAPGSGSTIFRTLTSLLSCFVTCSRGRSSTLTTMVMRLMSGWSVTPTASESMLKPRRENRAAIRARMPGVFSTRTESVCLVDMESVSLCLSVVFVVAEVGADAARCHDLVVGGAGGDHRPHHGVLVDDEVDDDRAVVDRVGLGDDLVQVGRVHAADRVAAHGLGQLDEVRDARALGRVAVRVRARVQHGVGVTLVVEQGLPLADHPEGAVVDDGDLDRDVVERAGGEFLVGHLEAAVAVDRPDRAVGR